MDSDTFPRSDAVKDKTLVDLSVEIYEDMPAYPGHQRTAVFDVKTHEDSRRRFGDGHTSATKGFLTSDHGPTHVDSISHFDTADDAPSIEEMPLHMFYTSAICVDVTHIRTPEDYLDVEGLTDALDDADLDVRRGDTVLLYTGHWNRHGDSDGWLTEYGGLTREVTEWLADRGVVNVGADAPSVDSKLEATRRRNGEPDYFPAHRVCKERRITNTEKLANLDKVAGKRFIFMGIPLPIRDGTASPIRAVALVD